MSFYNNLVINSTQLPLSEADAHRMKAGKRYFQTKSLEGMYGTYEITDEGYLEKTIRLDKSGPNGQPVWQDVRMVDAHGFIDAYENTGEEWFYFRIRFIEGRMVQVYRLKDIPENDSRTCTWELEIPVDEIKQEYDAEAIRRELSLLDARERLHLDEEFAGFKQRFPKELPQ